MDYMGLLHQKLQKVALTPKFLGVDLLEYIYSLYGATPKFDWVTREKVMDLRFDFRWSKLNERYFLILQSLFHFDFLYFIICD